LECRTWVDWREQQKLLKVRFHTPVVARTATYDIAYGNIVRSAYRGNPYDEAKFEVPAHWWADLSWPDGGLSLLTDSKYGYEAFDGTLSLSLLRGPLGPDPVSDQEEHRFTYALYPHTGDWRDSGVYREALDLNRPCACVLPGEHAGILPPVHSLLGIDATNVILEAFKAAECGKGRILRLVERHGRSGPVSVRFAVPIRSVSEVNLLERDESPLACERSGFRFEIKPYEIRTFWIR
jgi:alpha-mannosidase